MTDAILVYRDSDGDILWYGANSLKKGDAVFMLEKVKQSLTTNS